MRIWHDPDIKIVREIYEKNGIWTKIKKQLKAEGRLDVV
jgi:hypothetical protein